MGKSWLDSLLNGVKSVAPTVVGTAVNTVVPGAGGIASDFIGNIMRDITGDQEDTGDAQADMDRMAETIMGDPAMALEFKKAMMSKEVELAKLDAETTQQYEAQTTERMANEGKSEHWPQWAWRPWCGFTFPLAAIYAIHYGDTINVVVFSIVFGTWGAILGVSAHHRGKGKREAAGGVVPGMVGTLVNKLLK